MISLTHGEGYGLPLFEAAYNGMPVIAPGWSGQCDFLYAPVAGPGGGKKKMRPLFAEVEYDMAPVQKSAIWPGVIEEGSMWCYPKEGSFKMQLRKVRNKHDKALKTAKILQEYLIENFKEDDLYDKFANYVLGDEKMESTEYVFVSDLFHQQYTGGAELSLKTLIESTPGSATLANSGMIDEEFINFYKDSKWIFGNISDLSSEAIQTLINNNVEYTFIEFDYKLCKHRNPILYDFVEGESCTYKDTERGKLIGDFISNSKSTFFMSDEQRRIYTEHLPNIEGANTHVLSSLFDDHFFERIDLLNSKYEGQPRDDKWIVLGSNSWVKGALQSENWCKQNNVDYELIFGVEYDQFLKRLAQAKGLCAMPAGYDTCPRLVIEAKLLGCELQTNEYVQHRDEEWFNKSNDEIVKYLRTRKDYFWMHAFNG